jgi:diguanylate cyclase (GGDEF)-like protein/PAS domain S-box-containing protein
VDGAESLARDWLDAVAGTSYVPMSRPELLAYLTGLARELSLSDVDGVAAGAALVAAHLTEPAALQRSLAVLAAHGVGEAVRHAVAAGYARALRDRTLTEQEEIRDALIAAHSEAEARFRALFAGAPTGIGIAALDGTVLDANRSLAEMLGYTPEEVRRRRVDDLLHPDDLPDSERAYRDLRGGARDHMRLDKAYLRRDGTVVWADVVLSLIRDASGVPRYVVAMAQDVTERQLLQTRLRHQALHDPLTRLPNRTLFFERLAEVLARATGQPAASSPGSPPGPPTGPQTGSPPAPPPGSPPGADGSRIGVCYLDVDGFKMVNDTLGHDAGDDLLQTVARRLHAAVAGPGRLVARMGGDEFVVLVERCDGTEALAAVAEAALAAVREPVYLRGHEITVSASVGVVERPARGTSPAELMKAADTTLYWAKGDGRNRFALFDAERYAHEVTRFELAASLPGALERGEFVVAYQPLVRLADASVAGVEALVRWRHPKLGLLGPDHFIGLAEETGLIVALGRYVLAEACRHAADWPPLLLSVNVAARQVREPSIVDTVAAVLAETGLPAGSLQLELTESAVMGTTGEPLDRLRGLADLGVRIAIDDFGTGYSNLAYLRSLPVHALKLAGPFLAGLRSAEGADPVDEQIVATLVGLAHTLSLEVTAEGVETAAQAARLRALGCDTAQGWYYAAALPAKEIPALLASAARRGRAGYDVATSSMTVNVPSPVAWSSWLVNVIV